GRVGKRLEGLVDAGTEGRTGRPGHVPRRTVRRRRGGRNRNREAGDEHPRGGDHREEDVARHRAPSPRIPDGSNMSSGTSRPRSAKWSRWRERLAVAVWWPVALPSS